MKKKVLKKIKDFRNLPILGAGADFGTKKTCTTGCSPCQIRSHSAPEKLR